MEPEGSLLRLQESATSPYYDADQFSPHRPTAHFLKPRISLILPFPHTYSK